jgi:hypothetical protein
MKTRFEWQTEEPGDLPEAAPVEQTHVSRRRFGRLVLLLATAAIFIILLSWQLYRRQNEAARQVAEEVTLAFELQQQAAEHRDRELFSSMLSTREGPAWKRDQERLLEAGLVNDRTGMGLISIPDTRYLTELHLSPNLQQAELSYVQMYRGTAEILNGSALELENRLFYRLEDGRWKQTAAGSDYWGPRETVKGDFTSITFPGRDAIFAQGLSDLLDNRILTICLALEQHQKYSRAFCEDAASWRINLSTSVETMLERSVSSPAALSSTFDYELPAPSLIGIPKNESEYSVYIELYAHALLQTIEGTLLSTVPFPNQSIYALCFEHPLIGRHLYRYDRYRRSWELLLAAQAFLHLSSLPDDSAIMLLDDNSTLTIIPGDENQTAAVSAEVWQVQSPVPDARSLAGWVSAAGGPFQLIQHAALSGEPPAYSTFDLDDCDALSCMAKALPGFPVPSTFNGAGLYMVGSDIVLKADVEDTERLLGSGFSPFWVDENRFGFARFVGDSATGISTEVVLGSLQNSDLTPMFDSEDLARAAGLPWGSLLYVNEVIPDPANSSRLLVSSTGIRAYSGHYFLFSVDLSHGGARPVLNLEVARKGSQGGVPGLLSPTGPPPFLVSSNGRWLAMTELEREGKETWTVLIHDLQTGTTSEVSDSVPAMPGNYPLLDWSRDGQWLLLADRDFLHLIAPAFDWGELIAHDFDACSHIVWAE